MILSTAILLYQLFFVAVLYLANRLGRLPLNLTLAASLLWTATHVLMPPLAVLQATVILSTYFILRRKRRRM